MNLRAAYLSKKAAWHSFSPRSAREKRLLLLQGGAEEARFYQGLGWEVSSLAFAIGLTGGFDSPGQCFGVSAWAYSWVCDGMKYDAIVCNQGANRIAADVTLMQRVVALLAPNGILRLRLLNPEFFGDILSRRGYEMWPQPGDFPGGTQIGLAAFKESLAQVGCQLLEAQEELDPLAHNPEMPRWPSINGWDCTLYLPGDPAARKLHFIRSWWLEIECNKALDGVAGNASPADLKGVHTEIQDLLESVRLDEAGLVLDKLFQSGDGSAETCNLQGVLHFYRQNFRGAWDSFRMAILLDGDRLDFYENLADVAPKAGTVTETQAILARAKDRVAGVGEIHIDA